MIKVLYFEDEEAIKIGREYLKMQIVYNTEEYPTNEELDKYFKTLNLDPKYEFLLIVYLLEIFKDVITGDCILSSGKIINQLILKGTKRFLYKSTKSVFLSYAARSNDTVLCRKYADWIDSKDYKKFIKYISKSGVCVNIMNIAHLAFVKQMCDIGLSDNVDKERLESIRSNTVKWLNNCIDVGKDLDLYNDPNFVIQ